MSMAWVIIVLEAMVPEEEGWEVVVESGAWGWVKVNVNEGPEAEVGKLDYTGIESTSTSRDVCTKASLILSASSCLLGQYALDIGERWGWKLKIHVLVKRKIDHWHNSMISTGKGRDFWHYLSIMTIFFSIINDKFSFLLSIIDLT